MDVTLRDVAESDLPIFFEHQSDPDAARMADFPTRDREAFMAHWARILDDDTLGKKTILFGGRVAGHLVHFERAGVREVGYWLGQEYWGRGIATEALARFLGLIEQRPLYAGVATHNVGSRRVLEKCGFTLCGEEDDGFILKLEAGDQGAKDGTR
jgi:RimJ/RimL family protein N-acetyltransferase